MDERGKRTIILPRMRLRESGRLARNTIVAATACIACGCASLPREAARAELAAAERAFAQDAQARGIRAAFIEHFAPDGLVFEPAPVRVRETWPTRPAPADPLGLKLSWAPRLVDTGLAGDLGYSTGPFELVDASGKRPPGHGAFFSVWQRQADGAWKVWLDLGSRSDAPLPSSAWTMRPLPRRDGPGAGGVAGGAGRSVPDGASAHAGAEPPTATATGIMALDTGLSGLAADAIAAHLAEHARRSLDGTPPHIGTDWRDALLREGIRTTYEPAEARVSASGDFAASFGRSIRQHATGVPVRGYYVHVWLRGDAAWWLAVEALIDE
jgi:ketosteroid isomerase-like protein